MAFILSIFGAVALLLWGTYIVNDGVLKGFGSRIRKKIGQALGGRFKAFFTGLGVTLALQSSTATGMMASSFSASGILALEPGFMLMLGANVGTAVVAKALSFPIHEIAPLFLIIGVFMPRFAKSTRMKTYASIMLGLGLMLLSLHMLVSSLGGLPSSPLAQQIFNLMSEQPLLGIAFGAIAAWLCHSSVAVILLSVSIASTGHLPLAAGLATVLGANLGGALGPVLSADGISARRLPLANLIVRAFGVVLGAIFLPSIVSMVQNMKLEMSAATLVNAHLAFNLVLALVAAPFAKPVCAALMRFLPDPPLADDPGRPRHLIEWDALHPIHLVLSGAEREALRVADLMGYQLQRIPEIVVNADADAAADVASYGDSITVLGAEIRRNLQKMPIDQLSDEQLKRVDEIGVFVLSMEHSADIIAHQVVKPMLKRHQREGAFISTHKKVLIEMAHSLSRAHELSVSVFLRQEVLAAEQVIQEKIAHRNTERQYVRAREVDSTTTSLLNPDIDDDLRLMREMGRVLGYSSAIAYELLEQENPAKLAAVKMLNSGAYRFIHSSPEHPLPSSE